MSEGPRSTDQPDDGHEPPWRAEPSSAAHEDWRADPRAGADPTVQIGGPDVDSDPAYPAGEREPPPYDRARPDHGEFSGDPDDQRPRWLAPVLAGVGALLVGLLLGWVLWSGQDDPEDLTAQIAELDAENSDLRGQVDDLTAQVADLESGGAASLDELTAELEARDAEVERLTGESGDLAEQVSALEEENARLEARIEEILDNIDAALVPAPNLVGATAGFAAEQAEENGWVLVQIPSATDEVAPGTVLSQSPPVGTPMLSGSALAVSVAAAPEPAPEPGPGVEAIFEADGTGPSTSEAVTLEGGTRHALVYSFTGDGRHVVNVVDAEGGTVATLVDVNGTKDGGAALPLAGSYRFEVDVEDGVEWTVAVVTLP